MRLHELIPALEDGQMLRRGSWNPKVFIFRQVPSTIPEDIVPKMTSLPEAVKVEFLKRFADEQMQIDAIYYNDQLAVVNGSNVIKSYSASNEDLLATDWRMY